MENFTHISKSPNSVKSDQRLVRGLWVSKLVDKSGRNVLFATLLSLGNAASLLIVAMSFLVAYSVVVMNAAEIVGL